MWRVLRRGAGRNPRNSGVARQLLKTGPMPKVAFRAGALLVGAALFAFGCGDVSEDAPEDFEELLIERIALSPDSGEDLAAADGAPFQRAMDECYAESARPGLEVHTVGRYLALGDTMMAVRVSIPRAPALARCIEEAVMQAAPPGWEQAPDALGCGSFAIDLGGAPPPARVSDIARQYDEHQRGMAALMREVVERGLLPADHALVREALAAGAR
jgi:hypothetical protein